MEQNKYTIARNESGLALIRAILFAHRCIISAFISIRCVIYTDCNCTTRWPIYVPFILSILSIFKIVYSVYSLEFCFLSVFLFVWHYFVLGCIYIFRRQLYNRFSLFVYLKRNNTYRYRCSLYTLMRLIDDDCSYYSIQ